MHSSFIQNANEKVRENLSDEHFGVSELAGAMDMSRSNLLRKIKSETDLSASQFIRQIRLEHGRELIRGKQHTVSEVAYQVGFGSSSYFIKCFREHYGYPPGELDRHMGVTDEPIIATDAQSIEKGIPKRWMYLMIVLVGFLGATGVYWLSQSREAVGLEKSIAVLPFKNDSNDSTNLYLINGLMESTLNNLQKIKELKVVSRTSVEKYRASTKTVAEIAAELPVSYFVEGSGQKIGDRIQLNIQLIEAASDRHLWSKRYVRQVGDIFELQQEIAKNIAAEIRVIITPEEESRIAQAPTDNLEAYDFYLKGVESLNKGNTQGVTEAVMYLEQALELDQEFGLAYAYLAFSYYYMDIYQTDKKHVKELSSAADKALLYSPNDPSSLIAKAYYFVQIKSYELAVPYLERALAYSPNSAQIINTLSDFYTNYIPNTAKYLQYALKGLQVNVEVKDSVTTSYIYLHVSNALIQNGFVEEANRYIDVSLDYNPENYYSNYVRAFIRCAETRDLEETVDLLLIELEKDTTRMDILQEIAKLNYYQKEYAMAEKYYDRFIRLRDAKGLDIYRHESLKIGDVFSRMGRVEEGERYVEVFREYAEQDHSMYQPLSMTAYHAYRGDTAQALEYFREFAEQDDFQYWILLFLKSDPVMESLFENPEFVQVYEQMNEGFWRHHEVLRNTLVEEGLM
ncbi:hypothetical protein BFP72_11455 [Reichenbachiella sp. 5M10]|uniref:helix-turn-helix domain-containing protein n=1 Tax=Reichenbachiella sp. 5M10 TaxID=1889772 RepID=UPI000C150215|nr:helix-turn-helix domain-containing protein [Reichenbachiella sp. 5M10]PIB35967.1 hypothetical protein BFP72_11455 [Reichenbachiella sp. 5M10]